jgi:hypothetical protein
MFSFWSSITACFTGRSKPSKPFVLDNQAAKQSAVKIQIINYEAQRVIIEDNVGHSEPVELHQLKNKNLDSLIHFCQENAPATSRPPKDNSGNRFPVDCFPVEWPDLLNLHCYWWDRKNQPKTSSFKPSQPPLAQNYPPEDDETTEPLEGGRKSFIASLNLLFTV